MVFFLRGFAIVLTALWLVSGLGGSAKAAIILQTPEGLNPGEHFRFVLSPTGFVTQHPRTLLTTTVL